MSSLMPEPITKAVQDVPGEVTYWKKIPTARLPNKIWEEISEEEYNEMVRKKDE